ncbi:hypothetical protein LX36DRAFT_432515 [Colletotrichum falcatum]|nr:hypothetical protein LX36DRAFT_432515 [Colletotrichum falcatum]
MDRSQVSKRRGRPRKPTAPCKPDEERRRLQLRKAQTTFRARKQEAERAREERLAGLETMVDHMGHAFSELADHIIGSEAWKGDPGVLDKLAATASQVLALSRKSRDQEEPTGQPSMLERNPAPLARQYLLLPATVHVGPSTTPSAEADVALRACAASSKQYQDDEDIAAEYHDASAVQNPFGNGWFDRYPQFPSYYQLPRGPSLPDRTTFAFRLLISTLQNAYWSLVGTTEDSAALSDRIFRFSLLYHDKHEIQFNLRWFLGPGIAEGHMLMERNAATKPSIFRGDGNPTPNPGVGAAAASGGSRISSGHGILGSRAAYEPFATVKDVDEYLKERGARHIDSDIIELEFPLPGSLTTTFGAPVSQVPSPHIGRNHLPSPRREFDSAPDVLTVFDFNALLQPGLSPHRQRRFSITKKISNVEATHSAATRRRIRVQTLFQHLAGVSVCLVEGPAFEREAIDAAINASVVSD